jgi:hypothetical protein
MSREQNRDLELLALAAKSVLGKSYDLNKPGDLAALRLLAKEISETPDSPLTENIFDCIEQLDPYEPERIHVTPGVGVKIIDLGIPEHQRVLKKGRGYV